MGNTFKTAFLLTGLTLLLMSIGGYFGGQRGILTALIIAGVMNFVSYFYSDKIALATYRAQPVTREQLPRLPVHLEHLARDQHLGVLPAGIDDAHPSLLVGGKGEIRRIGLEKRGTYGPFGGFCRRGGLCQFFRARMRGLLR